MAFNKKEYLETFEDRLKLEGILTSYEKSPTSAKVRELISSEIYKVPTALIGVSSDIVDTYVTNDIVGKYENKIQKIHGLTELNLDTILDDLASRYDIGESLTLIMNLPPHKVEGGRYGGISKAHIEAQKSNVIYNNKDVNEIIKNLVDEYTLSEESIKYHANADPDGLVNIFGKTIVESKIKNVKEKLSDKEGNLNKTKFLNFTKYLVDKSKDKERKHSLEVLSINALKMYKPKEKQK
jgi:hypothetical protein